MLAEEVNTTSQAIKADSKIKQYAAFFKLRLSFLVVLSAAICFAIASKSLDWTKLMWLILGGFLVTGSSNGFNQVIERDLDKLMTRTASRPLVKNTMSVNEAIVIATVTGLLGIFILYIKMNPLSGILGLIALILYTVAYTPLKQQTPFAVFVGAFPGAIPPLLGCVAATEGFGSINQTALILFGIQFMWQFPHFWAIAWVIDDDYKKAGFKMLPSAGGRDKASAFQILVYTFSLIPFSLLPLFFHVSGKASAVVILICGIVFAMQSVRLYKTCEIKYASKLMFGSFIYLPVVQIAILMDKI